MWTTVIVSKSIGYRFLWSWNSPGEHSPDSSFRPLWSCRNRSGIEGLCTPRPLQHHRFLWSWNSPREHSPDSSFRPLWSCRNRSGIEGLCTPRPLQHHRFLWIWFENYLQYSVSKFWGLSNSLAIIWSCLKLGIEYNIIDSLEESSPFIFSKLHRCPISWSSETPNSAN